MKLDHYKLGQTNEQAAFENRLENREIATALINQAQQQLRVFTPDLEKSVYDDAYVIHAIEQLALRSRQTQIRVLVRDSGAATRSGHRLIELCRRHTSSIHLHITPKDIDDSDSAFLLVDNAGYIYKTISSTYKGHFNANDKLKVRELGKRFELAWEHSRPDPEMRRLFI